MGDRKDTTPSAEGITNALEGARLVYPDVPFDDVAIGALMSRRETTTEPWTAASVAELALALACTQGDTRALEHFARIYVPFLHDVLRPMGMAQSDRDDVIQEVQRKLLVSDEGEPKLLGYLGRGSLEGLLRVTATRTAISLLRKNRAHTTVEEDSFALPASADPELAFLKENYRALFREAFAKAGATLDAHERNILRLHFLRKVPLETLATMYQVHRATIVRQLARAKEQLQRETLRALQQTLKVDPKELESVLNLVRSQLDASVERLLKSVG